MNTQAITLRTGVARARILELYREIDPWERQRTRTYDFHEPGSLTGAQFTVERNAYCAPAEEIGHVERREERPGRDVLADLCAHQFLAAWVFNPCSVGIDEAVLRSRDAGAADLRNLPRLIGCPFLSVFTKPTDFLGLGNALGFIVAVFRTDNDNTFLSVLGIAPEGKPAVRTFCVLAKGEPRPGAVDSDECRMALRIAAVLASSCPRVTEWRRDHVRDAVRRRANRGCFSRDPAEFPVRYLFVTEENIGTGDTRTFETDRRRIFDFTLEPPLRLVPVSAGDAAVFERAIAFFIVQTEKRFFISLKKQRTNARDLLHRLADEPRTHGGRMSLHTVCRIFCLLNRTRKLCSLLGEDLFGERLERLQDALGRAGRIIAAVDPECAGTLARTTKVPSDDLTQFEYMIDWHLRNNLLAIRESPRNFLLEPDPRRTFRREFYLLFEPVFLELSVIDSREAVRLFGELFYAVTLAVAFLEETGAMDFHTVWRLERLLIETRNLELTDSRACRETLTGFLSARLARLTSLTESVTVTADEMNELIGNVYRGLATELGILDTVFNAKARILEERKPMRNIFGSHYHPWLHWL
ncbi:hypothetical protein [Sutterella sp.]|uniref:hypothetical protein n=1 Tax=Sutterella sp. TaxID=1981025 RepID=UPI0026DF0A73|nr:hypothetical protein [Sutterella sp.]MDO5532572.1 hypothetical protein [Sutterella sp.]